MLKRILMILVLLVLLSGCAPDERPKDTYKPPAPEDASSPFMVQVFVIGLNPDAWSGWEIDDQMAIVRTLQDDCTLHRTAGRQYVGACSPCQFGGDVYIPYDGADFITYFSYAPNLHSLDEIPAEEYCKTTDLYVIVEMKNGPPTGPQSTGGN